MNIEIRKAKTSELKLIQDMNHKLFLWDYARDSTLNIQWPYQEAGETYFRKMISGETGVCFVAESDKKLVGYVAGCVRSQIYTYDTVLRCELENIYVNEDTRGSGVGKELVGAFSEWCKEQGAQGMILDAYYQNKDAIKFYEACNFRPYTLRLEKPL